MENPPTATPAGETIAQLLAELKREYGVSNSAIARRIGAHHSTVSNWANGDAAPRPAALRALAEEFPKFTRQRLFAAIGKRAPAPLRPGRRDAILAVLDRMTEDQQEMILIQASALADSNDL